MWPDVKNLKSFCDSSLGNVVYHIIQNNICSLWSNLGPQNVFGLGYVFPYLDFFHNPTSRVIAGIPYHQTITRWPPNEMSLTTLIEETEFPFQDLSVDRSIIIHALEFSQQVRALIDDLKSVASPLMKM